MTTTYSTRKPDPTNDNFLAALPYLERDLRHIHNRVIRDAVQNWRDAQRSAERRELVIWNWWALGVIKRDEMFEMLGDISRALQLTSRRYEKLIAEQVEEMEDEFESMDVRDMMWVN